MGFSQRKRKKKKTHLLRRGWNGKALYEMKARAQKEKYLFSLLNRGLKFDVIGIESRIITAGFAMEIGREIERSKTAFTKTQLGKNNKLYYSVVL